MGGRAVNLAGPPMTSATYAVVLYAGILRTAAIHKMGGIGTCVFLFVGALIFLTPVTEQAGNIAHIAHLGPTLPAPFVPVGNNGVVCTVDMHDGRKALWVTSRWVDGHGARKGRNGCNLIAHLTGKFIAKHGAQGVANAVNTIGINTVVCGHIGDERIDEIDVLHAFRGGV